MKLEAKSASATYQVEITELPRQESERRFEISLTREGEPGRKIILDLISRSKGRRILKKGNRIVDLLITPVAGKYRVQIGSFSQEIEVYGLREKILRQASQVETAGTAEIKAQMPGRVIRVLKKTGDQVEAGEGIAVIEAMKMQNEIKAPKSGKVTACGIQTGSSVNSGDLLFRVE